MQFQGGPSTPLRRVRGVRAIALSGSRTARSTPVGERVEYRSTSTPRRDHPADDTRGETEHPDTRASKGSQGGDDVGERQPADHPTAADRTTERRPQRFAVPVTQFGPTAIHPARRKRVPSMTPPRPPGRLIARASARSSSTASGTCPPARSYAERRTTRNCPFAATNDGRVERSATRNGSVVRIDHCSNGWTSRSDSETASCCGWGATRSHPLDSRKWTAPRSHRDVTVRPHRGTRHIAGRRRRQLCARMRLAQPAGRERRARNDARAMRLRHLGCRVDRVVVEHQHLVGTVDRRSRQAPIHGRPRPAQG